MTILGPIEGITAPPTRAASKPDDSSARPAVPPETFLPYDETPLLSSRRADGWSAANQRLFLEAIAEGYGVEQATMRVGLSAASAYAFRRTAKGAPFALGWRAANLVARDAIAETLLVRALEGQVDTVTRADGSTITRHRHDNRLAMALLARLDRQVEAAPDADVKAARLVAQEFDAFLDLVARDEGPARAGLFLARRDPEFAIEGDLDPDYDLGPIYALAAADRFARTGVATAQEVEVGDLDLAARAGWTAEQWQRAEAAGLLKVAMPPEQTPRPSQHSQHSPANFVADPVWWDDEEGEWRTSFPPADGHFPDFEEHRPGDYEYQRSLSDAEAALMGDDPDRCTADELEALAADRDAYFGALAAGDAGVNPASDGAGAPPAEPG